MKSYKVFFTEGKIFIRWLIISTIIGVLAGTVGTVFNLSLKAVSNFRVLYPKIFIGLPIGGLAIIFISKITKDTSQGTNLVIKAIQSNEQLPLRMTPIYYIYTMITHLFTGGCGKEGTALQIGGSIGNKIGSIFHVNEKNESIATMCGMSAAFSALLGTPITAAVFSMEIASVGIMYYAALLPCSIGALIGFGISKALKGTVYNFVITGITTASYIDMVKVVLIGVICALASMVFCGTIHKGRYFFDKYFKNKYIGIFLGGVLIVLIMLILNNGNYLGAGIEIIENALNGNAKILDFVIKLFLTTLIIGSGYKGGEIIPALFVGSILGCCIGNLIDLNPSLSAALGMIGLFCGITNCPLASLFLSIELFGYSAIPAFLLVIGVSYMLSGYSSLYKSQRVVHSKVIAKNYNLDDLEERAS